MNVPALKAGVARTAEREALQRDPRCGVTSLDRKPLACLQFRLTEVSELATQCDLEDDSNIRKLG